MTRYYFQACMKCVLVERNCKWLRCVASTVEFWLSSTLVWKWFFGCGILRLRSVCNTAEFRLSGVASTAEFRLSGASNTAEFRLPGVASTVEFKIWIITKYVKWIFSQNKTENLFSSNRSIWVFKFAEFYADSKSEVSKPIQIFFWKILAKRSFFIITFLLLVFSIWLQIWNQRTILRILAPILAYLLKMVFVLFLINLNGVYYTPYLLLCDFAAFPSRSLRAGSINLETAPAL